MDRCEYTDTYYIQQHSLTILGYEALVHTCPTMGISTILKKKTFTHPPPKTSLNRVAPSFFPLCEREKNSTDEVRREKNVKKKNKQKKRCSPTDPLI